MIALANGSTLLPHELDELLAVAVKYRVTVLKIGDLAVQLELAPEAFETQISNEVVNAGGWKRGPDLDKDE